MVGGGQLGKVHLTVIEPCRFKRPNVMLPNGAGGELSGSLLQPNKPQHRTKGSRLCCELDVN